MHILAPHKQSFDLETLKEHIRSFLFNKFGPTYYKSLNDALIGLFQKGTITENEQNTLRELSFQKDEEHLNNAWNAYLENKNEVDFVADIKA